MAKIALVGASGFTGIELAKLLKKHPENSKLDLFSFSHVGISIGKFSKDLIKYDDILKDFKKINYNDYDIVFFACPNGTAMKEYYNIDKSNARLIDLAADFRLNKASEYLKWYKTKHKATNNIKKSIYALPEIIGSKVKDFNIISCPGCYPTSILLPLIPLIKKN